MLPDEARVFTADGDFEFMREGYDSLAVRPSIVDDASELIDSQLDVGSRSWWR